ncbi:MAG: hypothetical protein IKB16_03120, partial [Lentisphaeria bacterium]|nr:hypothetical protein [Lentisphaeria bacterium]
RAVGTGFRFISAFTDRLVLCAPSDFFKSVFQFSSIFCSVLAQTVEEPFFSAPLLQKLLPRFPKQLSHASEIAQFFYKKFLVGIWLIFLLINKNPAISKN